MPLRGQVMRDERLQDIACHWRIRIRYRGFKQVPKTLFINVLAEPVQEAPKAPMFSAATWRFASVL